MTAPVEVVEPVAPARKCIHVWMPPRAGGLAAKAQAMDERTYRVPGGGTVTFSQLIGNAPEHTFTDRWCLYCDEPHPDDVRAKARRQLQEV